MSKQSNKATGATPFGWHSQADGWRCLKEYQFRAIRGIQVPQVETPEALALGLCFHAARARWFSLDFAVDEKAHASIRKAIDAEAEAQKLPCSLKAQERALALITLYIQHWSILPQPTPVKAEYAIGPAALSPGFPPRTARLDDVSYYPGGGDSLWIGEAKTTSKSIGETVAEYELHGQTLLQPALYKIAPQGERKLGPVAGVMLDIVKKPYGDKKPEFARVPLIATNYALSWFVRDQHRTLEELAGLTWDSDPKRSLICTRLIGRMQVDCPFKALCQYGRSAVGKYLFNDGSSLLDWKPSEGKTVPPWV